MDDDDFDEESLVLLSVADVRVAVPAGNGVEAGLVVLEEAPEPHRQLRMYVGQPEARAIHVSWSRTVPPRPSTWDLFISTISLLDARVDQAIITDVEEQRHYFAQLVLHRAEEDEPVRLTARPSDAIALALRGYGARLFARPHVLDEAGLLEDGSHWVRPVAQPLPDGEEGIAGETEAAAVDGSGARTSEQPLSEVPESNHFEVPEGESATDASLGAATVAETAGASEPDAGPGPPAGEAPAAAWAPAAPFDRPREDRSRLAVIPPEDVGPARPVSSSPPPDRSAEAAGRAAAARSARSFRGRPPDDEA